MTANIITLDVRADFRSGQSPCDKIQGALSRVSAAEPLRLLVPFEPVPLYEVARNKGLTHESKPIGGGEWEVLFSPATEANPLPPPRAEGHGCGCGCGPKAPVEVLDMDARGLEPPQPMVKILEALTALPDNAVLRARTDRRPVHLYQILEARGFAGESEEQADGSFITHIRRS
jgi:TusA-related sulfurtransferase